MAAQIMKLLDQFENNLILENTSLCNRIVVELRQELDSKPGHLKGLKSSRLNTAMCLLCEYAELQIPGVNEMDLLKVMFRLILLDEDTVGQHYIALLCEYLTVSKQIVLFNDRNFLDSLLKSAIKNRNWKTLHLLSLISELSKPGCEILNFLLIQADSMVAINQLLVNTTSMAVIHCVLELLTVTILPTNARTYRRILTQILPTSVPRNNISGKLTRQRVTQNLFIYTRRLVVFNINKEGKDKIGLLPLRRIKHNGKIYQDDNSVFLQLQPLNRMYIWYQELNKSHQLSTWFVEVFLDNLTEVQRDEGLTKLAIRCQTKPKSQYISGVDYFDTWKMISFVFVLTQTNPKIETALFDQLISLAKDQSELAQESSLLKQSTVSTIISLRGDTISSDDSEIMASSKVIKNTNWALPSLKLPLLIDSLKESKNLEEARSNSRPYIDLTVESKRSSPSFEPQSSPPLHEELENNSVSMTSDFSEITHTASISIDTSHSMASTYRKWPFEVCTNKDMPPQCSILASTSILSDVGTSNIPPTSANNITFGELPIELDTKNTAAKFESFSARLPKWDAINEGRSAYGFDDLRVNIEFDGRINAPSFIISRLKSSLNQLSDHLIIRMEALRERVALKPRVITRRVNEMLRLHRRLQIENQQRLVTLVKSQKKTRGDRYQASIEILNKLEERFSK